MTFSIRATIRGLVAPKYRLSCSKKLWLNGLSELRRRGGGYRESGAFLLGVQYGNRRHITRFVYYDDLDPNCLNNGIVVFDGSGYGPLWQLCRDSCLTVVADIHTHPGLPRQSGSDRTNPMIAMSGHIALIVPDLAKRVVATSELGIYEYKGSHQWVDHSGPKGSKSFYVGIWG